MGKSISTDSVPQGYENVRIEKSTDGQIWTIILHRPNVRNAVDQITATALGDAFIAFDNDNIARVGVFWGEGGTFCAGYDLKSVAATAESKTRQPIKAQWDHLGCCCESQLLLP